MWKSAQRLCGVLFMAGLAACASSGAAGGDTGAAASAGASGSTGSTGSTAASVRSGSRDLLTKADIERLPGKSAYEVVESLRSNWLRTRGSTALSQYSKDTQIQVYINDTRAGGIEQLRGIPSATISYIRWYDGNAASGRWGLDHGAGVIYVSTRNDSPTR